MLMNTHFQIAKSVLENMDEKKAVLISERTSCTATLSQMRFQNIN